MEEGEEELSELEGSQAAKEEAKDESDGYGDEEA